VHSWSARVREMMASLDAAAFAAPGAESESCCGTCSSEATCTVETTDAGEAAMAKLPPAMLEEMKKCVLCTVMMEQPEMMFAAKPEVVTLKSGVIFTDTVIDKANVKKYHAFQTKFHDRIEELKVDESWASAKGKICSFCWKFAEIDEAGAIIDWSLTNDGTVTVITSKEPAVVEKIHALAEEVKACCEMFEAMQ